MSSNFSKQVSDNLRKFRKSKKISQDEMAKITGLSRRSYSLYELGQTTPKITVLETIASHFDISVDELITQTTAESEINIIGLAKCGPGQWHQEENVLNIKTPLPHDMKKETSLAVMAMGTSMQPQGIKAGDICLVDSSKALIESDIAYIKTKDGHYAIKVFIAKNNGWVKVKGYLPPIGEVQAAYFEDYKEDDLELIAPVVYIKKKN